MKRYQLLVLSLVSGIFLLHPLQGATPEAKSHEEFLFARRVIELWKGREYALTRGQISLFFKTYPTSDFEAPFQAILGDIALEEKKYTEALTAYALIRDPDILKQIIVKRWRALYQLQRYEELYDELLPKLPFLEEEEGRFYFAEAALRTALKDSDPDEKLYAALKIYTSLSKHEQFGGHAQLAMAEIYRHLEKIEEAAQLYLQIAQEQKNPQTLYHAATLLTLCDEPHATELFSRLAKGGGTRAAEAAYQWLQLLAKNKQWETLHKERRCFLTTLRAEHLASYYFYLGMLAYEAKNFTEAVESLQQSLQSGLKPPHDKQALLALLTASQHCAALSASEYAYHMIQERYPDQLETAALFHALCYRAAGHSVRAHQLLTHLISVASDSHVLESAYINSIQLATEMHDWEDAHACIAPFFTLFPLSTQRTQLLRLAVELSLADIDRTNNYIQLSQDIEKALDTRDVYTSLEIPKQKLLLAKCYFKMEQESKALSLLQTLLDAGYETASVHYFMTLLYMKQDNASDKVIHHGEQALVLDPSLPEGDRLHLYLFNAYLAKNQESIDNEVCEQRAAAHLYAILDVFPLSLENQLWLAHTYGKQKESYPQAKVVLTHLFCGEKIQRQAFPKEAYLLASLYHAAGEEKEALSLLESLCEKEEEVQLLLASIYVSLNRNTEALALYRTLEHAEDFTIALKAKAAVARATLYQAIALEEISRSPTPNFELNRALDKLKEVWIHKDLLQEPLHLEAALDFVDFKRFYMPEESSLQWLSLIKEHFTTENDLLSKDYQEARPLHPEQDQIYQAYMRLLEAKIYLAQTTETKMSGKESDSRKKAAHALITTLTQGKYPLTPYLTAHIEIMQEEVKKRR